jgi:hypothetical protein
MGRRSEALDGIVRDKISGCNGSVWLAQLAYVDFRHINWVELLQRCGIIGAIGEAVCWDVSNRCNVSGCWSGLHFKLT